MSERGTARTLLLIFMLVAVLLISFAFGQGSGNDFNLSINDTAPVISSIQVSATNASAVITWQTDKPADSEIEYGTSLSYGAITPIDPTLSLSHSVAIGGLNPSTTYHFNIRSADINGILQQTGDNTFSTLANPVIGNGTGLRGEYYDNIDFTSFKLSRVDPMVSFNWGMGAPDPSMGVDTFSIRWTGQVQAKYSEIYTFYTYSDDGVRLWVNGQLIVDDWSDHSARQKSGTISLVAGQRYDIDVDYYDSGGMAQIDISWSSASLAKETIPQTQLYPTNVFPASLSFSTFPSTITQGQSTTLIWSSTGATSVSIDNGIGTVALSGSAVVAPAATTTYTATASNAAGPVTQTATVIVNMPPGLAIISPAQGSAISSPAVNVNYITTNMPVDADHVNFKLDANPEVSTTNLGGTYQFTNVPIATHTLSGYVARLDNSKIIGTDTSVTFDVIPPPVPAVSISASPTTITAGQSAALSWSTTNATSISIDQGIGSVAPSGSRTVSPAVTTTYTLTATNAAGTSTISATITVLQPPSPPAITFFTGTPLTINPGQLVNLSWSVASATSVSIDQGIGTVASAGSKIVSPSVTTTYTLTAANSAGSTTAPVTVAVNTPLPSGTLSVSPSTIAVGQSAALTWTSSGAATASIDQGIGTVAASGTRTVTPAATTTYTLTLTNAGGSVTKSATLTVLPLPPTTLFSSSPGTITQGQSSTLTWSTSGATSVSIDNGIGTVTASGTRTVTPAATTTYILTATNAGGSVTNTTIVTVNPPPPTSTFSGSPLSITQGQSSTLTWSTSGATSVSINNGIGTVTASGTRTVTPATNTTYILTATNAGGSTTKSVTINVNPPPPPSAPTATFSGSPTTITAGQSANLTWTTSGATSVSINNGIGTVTASGTRSVSPAVTTTYVLTATNAGGSVTPSVTITVQPLPPTANISSSPSSIIQGQSANLSWTTAGATSVSIDQGIGSVALSGSLLVNPGATTIYTIAANNSGGSVTRSSTVTVTQSLPSASLTVSPSSITSGQSSTLSWSVANSTNVSIDNGIGTVAAAGSLPVSPAVNTTYTLTATSAAGSTSRPATLIVNPVQSSSDTEPPNVTIDFPANGSSVSGFVTINVTATDNVLVTLVSVYKNGVFLADDTAPPYEFSWNTSSESDGLYKITAKATDSSGNVGNSAPTDAYVDNLPPIVSSISISSISTNSASIAWMTDKMADGQIEYGTSTSYGSLSALDSAFSTSHNVMISNLQSGTTYHFRMISKNAKGVFYPSDDNTFTTLSPQTTGTPGSSGGGSSGGGGSKSISTVPVDSVSLSATTTKADELTVIDVPSNFFIKRLDLLGAKPSTITVDVKRFTATNVPPPPGNVYGLVKLDVTNKTELKYMDAEFEIPISWMQANGFSVGHIKFLRLSPGWQRMPTQFIGNTSTSYRFRSVLPGFSIFAVTGELVETPIEQPIASNPEDSLPTILKPIINNSLVSKDSAFTIPQQYFILSGAFFIIAILIYLFYHRRKSRKKPTTETYWTPSGLAEN